MRFKVTEYELRNGVECVKHEYCIEPDLLTRTQKGLQKLVYAGMISGFSIKPMQEVQNDKR